MRVLEKVRQRVAEANKALSLNLELMPDRCADDHTVWVIRPRGAEYGGLVVAHIDDGFTAEDLIVLEPMLTLAFFAEMHRLKYFTQPSWCYLDGCYGMGMFLIQIMGECIPNLYQYWSDNLQSMLRVV